MTHKISPEAYRQLNPRVEGEEVEIGGERLSLTPENAGNIRRGAAAAVRVAVLRTSPMWYGMD